MNRNETKAMRNDLGTGDYQTYGLHGSDAV